MMKVNFRHEKESGSFRIGRRCFSLLKKINSRFVVAGVVFLAGSACLWFAQVVEAGITQWQANSVTAVDNDGNGFSCAIANNKVYCWGTTNTYGQLGTGDNTTVSLIPRQIVDPNGVLAGRQLTQLAISNSGAVCVIASGVVNCWGRGATYYLLGNNTTANRYYPGPVAITGVVTSIAGGDAHFCAVANGLAYCWGSGGSGRLGDNATTTNRTPGAVTATGVLSGKTVTDIGAGGSHTCAVASGAAYCWGSDASGELGDNTTLAGSNVPVTVLATGVLSGKTVTAIDADSTHTCAIASGASYCWGLNDVGQLGDTTTTQAPVPVATKADQNFPLDGKTVRSVDAGNKRTCVTDTEENAYCWGRGPLGDGANLNSSYPVRINASGQVLNGMSVGIASAGYTGTCFVNSFSNMYCTSLTANGTLGNNTTNASNPPVLALFSYGIETSAYRFYQDSTSATPGSPLGIINSPVTLPTAGQSFRLRTGIQTKYQFTQMSVGYGHACGISTDGYAYCWGNNAYGALGNSAGGWQPMPVDRSGVLAGKTLRQISAGAYHSCAIASDGKAYCWGYDGDKGLGNSASGDSTAPVAVDVSGVLSGKTLVSISAGGFATCVITSESDTYCGVETTMVSLVTIQQRQVKFRLQ